MCRFHRPKVTGGAFNCHLEGECNEKAQCIQEAKHASASGVEEVRNGQTGGVGMLWLFVFNDNSCYSNPIGGGVCAGVWVLFQGGLFVHCKSTPGPIICLEPNRLSVSTDRRRGGPCETTRGRLGGGGDDQTNS